MHINPRDIITFEEGENLGNEFEVILRKHGLTIAPGSALERGLLVLLKMNEAHKNTKLTSAPWPNLGADLQEALGVLHVIQLVVRNQWHNDFRSLLPHLRKLNQGEVAQTRPALITNGASNKIFELFVALAAMHNGHDIVMDDPDKAQGDNPDVIGTMSDRRRWGYACKVVHGEAPKTLFDRISDGVDQIESSPSEIGLVVISFKNHLRHRDLLPTLGIDADGQPILGAHVRYQDAVVALASTVEGRVKDMIDAIGEKSVLDAFIGKKALPGILVPVSAGIGVTTSRGPIVTTLGFLQLLPLERQSDASRFTETTVAQVLKKLNEGFTPNPRK